MHGKKNKYASEDFALTEDRKEEGGKATSVEEEVVERDGLDVRLYYSMQHMDDKISKSRESGYSVAVFGGGCFWCTEAVFQSLNGVISAEPGYSGGKTADPTYDEVSSGKTGHVESVKIVFDPSKISYADLLTVFFYTHDPTTLNRQGNDVGTQYASVVFYGDETQRSEAERMIDDLNRAKAYPNPVVTSVRPLGEFYLAEDYHRKYYLTHKDDRYCEIVIAPKMEKMQKRFAELMERNSS